MSIKELQAAIEWWDSGGPSRPLPSEVVVAIRRFVEAARLYANPNIEAADIELDRVMSAHRPRPSARTIIAAALTPGDTDGD